MPTSKPEKKEPKKPLSVTHPELAKEADGWDPTIVFYSSEDRLDWKCKNSHQWSAKPRNRSGNGLNVKTISCPYCSGKLPEAGKNDLGAIYPEVAKEADGWDPTVFFPGSNAKMKWKCNQDHQWQTAIYERTKGKTGCPYCKNTKVLSGFNDLATTNPDLAKEASGWDPSTVNPGSHKKMNWKCEKGHIWNMPIVARTGQNQGCAVCANRKIVSGVNDLGSMFPEIAKQADGWDPSKIGSGSHKIVKWKCKKGHTWKAQVGDMTTRNHLCPFCSNHKFLKGLNDLESNYPELAKQAFNWNPQDVHYGTRKKLEWKCGLGHIWKSTVNSRTSLGASCPYCSGHKMMQGFNDLATTHPDLAKEAYGWDPAKIGGGTSLKLSWKCHLGHIYEMNPISRTFAKQGCPICANKKVLIGFNDLATTHPLIALQAEDWDPTTVSFGAGSRKKWKCSQGHIWTAQVASRAQGRGCPYCSNKLVLQGFNDLATTHPALALQLVNGNPDKIIGGNNKKYKWKCSEGHIWTAQVASRVAGRGCPYCSGKQVFVGFNDLLTSHPELAEELVDGDPETLTKGVSTKFTWKCNLGHTWKSSVGERTRGSGCPYCSGNQVFVGFNDLLTTHPELSKEASGWDPTAVSAGSNKKVKWICKVGHKWVATTSNRVGRGSGCPTCAESGFDPNKDAYLYFLQHLNWEMLQIGITNVPDDRLKDHKKLGWDVLELRGPMDGHLTQQWETAILRMLKSKGADLSNEKIAGKFDGYSEAWTKATFPVDSIKELMRLTDEFEENLGKGRRVE
jgi:hypothetical protein